MMPSLALLLPSFLDLAGWAGVVLASVAMCGIGRLVTGGRAAPESALLAGWGVCVLLLTGWGIATPASMRVPALALLVIGLVALLLPRTRLSLVTWCTLARVALLGLPLLLIMISARPALPDTWLNLLPNAVYLYDHNFFPADARPAAHSFIAGAPYNMQLVSYMAGLLLPDFPASAMIDFNIVLLLAAGLLLARIMTKDDAVQPRWPVLALGLLLAVPLNPGFDPRYHLSAYSETSVMVALLFAGWHAARALDRFSGRRDARDDILLLTLILAVLVNIKQESVALAFGIVASGLAVALMARAERGRAMAQLLFAALPALMLYLGWRWYVLHDFALGELKGLPYDQWHIRELPLILLNMLRAIGERGVYFAILFIALAIAAWRLWRRELDLGTRVAAMLLGSFVVYNLALLGAYVAHFEGQMGIEAHSYFRYNTHLGLLLMGTIVLYGRDGRWSEFGGRWARALPAVVILLVLLVPFPFLRMLRFDLEVPNLRAYQLAHEVATRIADHEHLLLILPGDNGTLPPTIEGVLRDLPPRRPNVEFDVATDLAAGLAIKDDRRAVLSCAPPGFALIQEGHGALLARVGAQWQVEASWTYPPAPPGARWSQVLAPAPLCLPPKRAPG
ncbi:MAG TPA: hypothetical protein VHX19_20005 [Stellaceae bacterium]|jgi:hypothetical protein|nr:hypothetical protein [Stellaceae bacterium]